MSKNRGRECPCGRGRGFRRWQTAQEVHDNMTTAPARYQRCTEGLWHWG